MLSVDEAIEAILARARPLPAIRVPLRAALGATLAEDVRADIDLPPFDKALMDGYAVRSVDLAEPGDHELRIVAEIFAGQTSTRPLRSGEAALIMTGAPLPSGADAVVMVERAKPVGDRAVIVPGPVAAGSNRLERAREMRSGEVVVPRGTRIRPAGLGLLASTGRSVVAVVPFPSVRVVPTGDELVPVDRRPEAGQIRDSNSAMLAALAEAWGVRSIEEQPIAPDEPRALRSALGSGLGADVLLISGGVSAGLKDLVPSTLVDLGVEPVFHKVRVKPGKPLWFGAGPDREGRPGALVFGLPGNPASGLVGFLLFVRPALEALAGRADPRPRPTRAALARPFRHRGDRPTYHPSRIEAGQVEPLEWAGSADLRTVAMADGFAVFPAGDRDHQRGDFVEFLPLD